MPPRRSAREDRREPASGPSGRSARRRAASRRQPCSVRIWRVHPNGLVGVEDQQVVGLATCPFEHERPIGPDSPSIRRDRVLLEDRRRPGRPPRGFRRWIRCRRSPRSRSGPRSDAANRPMTCASLRTIMHRQMVWLVRRFFSRWSSGSEPVVVDAPAVMDHPVHAHLVLSPDGRGHPVFDHERREGDEGTRPLHDELRRADRGSPIRTLVLARGPLRRARG